MPPWSAWFDPADIAEALPDPEQRRRVVAEQPRLPLAHFEQDPPVPPSRHRTPWAYLMFSAAYEAEAAVAVRRGATVSRMPGGHIHQVVDPRAVADRLEELARAL